MLVDIAMMLEFAAMPIQPEQYSVSMMQLVSGYSVIRETVFNSGCTIIIL